MKHENTKSIALLTAALIVLVAVITSHASGSVELSILKTLQLDATPVDVVVAPDGRRIYVLTSQGEILIYLSIGKLEARVQVGNHVDQMKLGPGGDSLILTSRENKTVEIVALDFIQKINVSGSPFKGPEGAPVVVAVFSDFQ